MSESPTVQGQQQLILDPGAIADKPRQPLHPGVTYSILWREGRSVAGILRLENGAQVPAHVHDDAEHHVWSVEGRVRVDGRTLGPGAYWHVPAGVTHALEGAGPGLCTLYYLYLERSR